MLLLAGVLALLIIGWAVGPVFLHAVDRPPGDGQTVESYGFDLTTCLVPRERIAPWYGFRDQMQALIDPPTIPGREVEARNQQPRSKYLVPSDRVIGVAVNGQARAYPITMLNNHEIVNDTLGGAAIAVTYNPLCDSAVVFDRRPIVRGETASAPLTFGVSGLVHNSNLLMYDRNGNAPSGTAATGSESLWSQLLAKAVTGPAARQGAELRALPAAMASWAEWLQRHPDTTVLAHNPDMRQRYRQTNYAGYYLSDKLLAPVNPLPTVNWPQLKSRVAAVTLHGETRVYPLIELANHAENDGSYIDRIGGIPVRLTCRATGDAPSFFAEVLAPGAEDDPAMQPQMMYSLWFAWHAHHPELSPAPLGK